MPQGPRNARTKLDVRAREIWGTDLRMKPRFWVTPRTTPADAGIAAAERDANCPTCDGAGKVLNPGALLWGAIYSEECPDCGGSGRVEAPGAGAADAGSAIPPSVASRTNAVDCLRCGYRAYSARHVEAYGGKPVHRYLVCRVCGTPRCIPKEA